MSGPDLLLLLVAGIVVLTPLAGRIKIPQPVLLTLFGLAVGVIPAVPAVQVPPDFILPMVLPPLLFAATQRTSLHEFRAAARPVLLLAVGLTVASAAASAVVAHALGVSWALAWLLGAMVSPPDPVAATSVARRLSLPRRIVAVLEGEGLFNDATALVLYEIALRAAVTGQFSLARGAELLLLAVGGGLAIGLVVGWLGQQALARVHEAPAEITLTIAVPYVAYLAADRANTSGVLAVLAAGLYLNSRGHRSLTPGGFLLGRQVWSYADFAVASLAFAFLGVELAKVLGHRGTTAASFGLGAAVIGTLVAVRIGWTFPAAWLARAGSRRRSLATPYTWRETAVVAWSGMRGVVTVATALAIPLSTTSGAPLPRRNEIVLVALGTVLVTLLVQGLTLTRLVQLLGVRESVDETAEVIKLRRQAAQAAMQQLRGTDVHAEAQEVRDQAEGDQQVTRRDEQEVRRALLRQYEGLARARTAIHDLQHEENKETLQLLDQLRSRAIETERGIVLEARARGEVSAEVADRVLADVELRAMRGHE